MNASTRPDWAGRLHAVHQHFARLSLDALVISNPINIKYLTGFSGSAGVLVCSAGADLLLVDGRYEAVVRQGLADGHLGPVQLVPVELRYDASLAAVLEGRNSQRTGFEAGHLTVAMLSRWQAGTPGTTWIATEDLIERARCVKDDFELAVLRRAAARLSDVARGLKSWVAAGDSELEVAARIDAALTRAGFSAPAFQTIVASGPNSAYPHARPTDRRLTRGDLVVLDFGGVLDGYCVDLTRMAAVGRPEPAAEALVTAVRDAQSAAIAAIHSGVLPGEVDRAARSVLEQRGLGEAFLHGTGHGLGLEVHEAPRIGRAGAGGESPLAAGMVCTVEPGAYVAGLGGVRLEDDVLVTAGGCEVLTDAPLDILVV